MNHLAVGFGALVACAGAGCSEDGEPGLATLPTRVAVQPAAFLGELPCSTEPGAMRAYVVTLFAWSGLDDVTPFSIGASYPTSCARTVTFENVVTPGTYYTAEVQGYAELPESLEPFGGFSSGSATMLDAESGETVVPRWRTRCGASPSEGVMAVENQARFITHCAPLEDAEPSTTAIRFSPAALFGPAPCETVSRWSIYPEQSALAPVTDQSCDGPPVDFVEGVTPGNAYAFYLAAQLGDVALGTECFVNARAGVTVAPTCGALLRDGYVDVRLAELAADDTPLCAPGVRFDLVLDGATLNVEPLPCELPARVGPLAPGDYLLDVVLVDPSGVPTGGGASCSAAVEAGRAVDAVCAA